MTTRRRSLILLNVVLLGTSCGVRDTAENGSETVQVDTLESDRIQVINTGPAWSQGQAWTAEEELRLGTLAGEGPGELMRASGLNWGPDGNLWVWDPGGRFSIFTRDGTFVDSRPRQVSGVVFPWRGEFDVDGSLIDWGLDYPGLDPRTNPSPDRIIYYPVRFSGDFSSGDTLPTLEFDFEMTDEGERKVFSEGLSSFQDRKGAIWFAHDKAFTLYRRTLEGDTTLEFSIDATPVSVAQSDIDSVAALYAGRGRPEAAPGPERFASTKPMIRRIFADGVGHVFVLSDQEELPLGTFVDVFRENGRYLGRMELPARVNFPYPPPHATDTHLYYVTTDDLDVEYVVRARLDKPGGGPA